VKVLLAQPVPHATQALGHALTMFKMGLIALMVNASMVDVPYSMELDLVRVKIFAALVNWERHHCCAVSIRANLHAT